MKKGFTDITFIVDRSGSMSSVATDTIGGFNSYVKKQRETNVGECRMSFNQFDEIFEEVYQNLDIKEVKDLDDKTFVPRGWTALLDAVGNTIENKGKYYNDLPEHERPEKVLIVILTDGEENASKKYSYNQIQEMVKHQTETYQWEFVFLGANQDSWAAGQALGVSGSNTLNFVSKGKNKISSNSMMWNTLSDKTSMYRSVPGAKMSYTAVEQKVQNDLVNTNDQ
jgi:hypothetical protein